MLDFCGNDKKNKSAQPPLSSLFQDSEETNPSTETNNTSYESPNTLEPEEQGRGIIMGAPHPPSVKCLLPFLSKVVEAK
jgi:hypothetical protein